MTRFFHTWLSRVLVGAGAAATPLVLALSIASAADPAPPKPSDAKDTAKDAAKDAKDTAKDAKQDVKDNANAAKQDAKDASKDAKDTANAAKQDAKDTANSAKQDAKSAAADKGAAAKDAARDTARDTRDSARDTRDARDARDARGRDDRDRGDRDRDRGDRDRGDRDRDRGDRDRDRDRGDRDRSDRSFSLDRSSARGQFRSSDVRSADIGIWFSRSTNDGLVISDVSTRGPIAKLGFREGDRIVSINGQRVTREADFVQYLFADDVRNDRVKVIVLRDGAEEVILVEPALLVEDYSTPQVDPLEQFGIVIDDRYTDRIVVWKVVPRSPAFYAGFRTGDVITTFRGQPVKAHQEFVQTVQNLQPGQVDVVVDRNKKPRTLQVDYQQRADVERPNQRREERIENRIDRRDDRRDDRREGAGAAVEVSPNGVRGEVRTTQPAPQPARGGLLPRRGR